MLTVELINNNIPRLQLQDTVGKAIQLVNDFKLTHLPVVIDKKFLGLISEEDLLDVEDEKITIEAIQHCFILASVKEDVHFLNAVNVGNQWESNIVPVLNKENEFVGVITTADLLRTLGDFAGANEIGGIIVLQMSRIQFAISEISRIVESNDCTILHLNTIINPATEIMMVTLHINKKEIASIVATFERYQYEVLHCFGVEEYDHDIDSNYRHLINYLDI